MVRIDSSLDKLSAVYGFEYIDNRNISGSGLCKDELRLLEEDKYILVNNFLFYSKRHFLGARTHHPKIHIIHVHKFFLVESNCSAKLPKGIFSNTS